MTTLVIKYGGHALDDQDLRMAFAKGVASLVQKGYRLVIVHGGGPQINTLLKALSIQSEFRNGLRVTDEKALSVVEMVLCGQVNKFITRLLEKENVDAVGISGEDAKLFLASPVADLGRVGSITKVNARLPLCLLANGFTPVIAPLALDMAGEPLNVNADIAAGALAGALKAEYFVLISDVPGVLDRKGNLIESLDENKIGELISDGVITGGMVPKTQACINALQLGCAKALILDGRSPGSLERWLTTGEALGTMIKGQAD